MALQRVADWTDDSGTRRTPSEYARENARHDRLTGGRRYLIRGAGGSWLRVSKAEHDAAEARIAERCRAGLATVAGGAQRQWSEGDVALYEHDHALPKLTGGTPKQVKCARSFRPGVLTEVARLVGADGFDAERGRLIQAAARGETSAERFLSWKDRPTPEIVEHVSHEIATAGMMIDLPDATRNHEPDDRTRDVA